MTTLADVTDLARHDQFLAVVSTTRADHSVQASLVNAGVMPHPVTGVAVVGFVSYGKVKLGNLRQRPQLALTFRSGWKWATVEGRAELVGPDNPLGDVDAERLRLVLREVFVGAGGSHDHWDQYDRAMLDQRRTAVFVTPERIYSN